MLHIVLSKDFKESRYYYGCCNNIVKGSDYYSNRNRRKHGLKEGDKIVFVEQNNNIIL